MNNKNITIDNNIFDEIYKQYSKLIYSVCFHILLSKHEAEDAMQETFVKYALNYRKVDNPKYWLIRVANNYCIDQYHRKKRHRNYIDKTKNRVKTIMKTITMAFSNKDQLQRIFKGLDEKDRFLLTLKIGYDYKYEEIADILGTPVGTVKSSLSRLLKKIKG